MPPPRLLSLPLKGVAVAAAVLSSATLALGLCEPALPSPSAAGPDALLNVFALGRSVSTWEYLPPSPSWPKSGGALYLSQTDTPEDGAFYFSQRASADPGQADPVWTLSLGSEESGVKCVRTQGKDMPVTMGPCDEVEAEFTLSCLSCASSSSSLSPPGTPLARGCTLRSAAAAAADGGGQCVSSVAGGGTGVAPPRVAVVTRGCRGGRAAGQVWDLRLA